MDRKEDIQHPESGNEQMDLLIVGYLTNDINEEGLRQLTRWLDSEENLSYFNKIKAAWILSGVDTGSIDTNRSWEEHLGRITSGYGGDKGLARRTGRMKVRHLLPFAAAVILAFALGALSVYLVDREKELPLVAGAMTEVKETVIEAPLGSRSRVVLPDNSEVWLNAGSTLRYTNDFGINDRQLELTGEAYFSVISNAQKPFIVKANDVSVRALGTKFNVKAYPEEQYVTAILKEGIIDVVIADLNHEKITLNPNEKITIHKQAYQISEDKAGKVKTTTISPKKTKIEEMLIVSKVNADLSTSWKDKQWKVTDESVTSLVPMLGRRYGRSIIIRDYELDRYKFTGTIENESIEHILEALRQTAPLDYTIYKDSIVLSLNQENKAKFAPILRK